MSPTVGGVTALEWLDALTQGRKKEDWQNLSCTGEGCLAPPTTEQVTGCLITPST
jgi:hypothetical protein